MPTYRIELRPGVQKTIDKLPRPLRIRVLSAIANLETNPRPYGCTKLAGSDEYRIRVHDYRVVYLIQDAQLVVAIVRVGPRGKVYR